MLPMDDLFPAEGLAGVGFLLELVLVPFSHAVLVLFRLSFVLCYASRPKQSVDVIADYASS